MTLMLCVLGLTCSLCIHCTCTSHRSTTVIRCLPIICKAGEGEGGGAGKAVHCKTAFAVGQLGSLDICLVLYMCMHETDEQSKMAQNMRTS